MNREDLAEATHARTADGWHRIIRRNKATVSLEGVEPVPYAEILETKVVGL